MRRFIDHPVIALDFDETCVKHAYPEVGEDIGAVPWLLRWVEVDAQIILWTMRDGLELAHAKAWFEAYEIPLVGVQLNPSQSRWTSSPKCYAKLYIDDHGFGVPLIEPKNDRPYVDWSKLGPAVLGMLDK